MIGSRIRTLEFDNKSIWKFTTALVRKLSDGRLFFTKLFLTVHFLSVRNAIPHPLHLALGDCDLVPIPSAFVLQTKRGVVF